MPWTSGPVSMAVGICSSQRHWYLLPHNRLVFLFTEHFLRPLARIARGQMDRVCIAFSSHRELKPSTNWTRLVSIFEFVPELKRSVCPLGIRPRNVAGTITEKRNGTADLQQSETLSEDALHYRIQTRVVSPFLKERERERERERAKRGRFPRPLAWRWQGGGKTANPL